MLLSLYFESSKATFLSFVGCFPPKAKWAYKSDSVLHDFFLYEVGLRKYLQIATECSYELMSTMIASILVLYSARYKVHKFDKIAPSLAIRWARTEKRSSVETDAKSTGSSFCRKDRGYKTKTLA